jgi:hypothetical protein
LKAVEKQRFCIVEKDGLFTQYAVFNFIASSLELSKLGQRGTPPPFYPLLSNKRAWQNTKHCAA